MAKLDLGRTIESRNGSQDPLLSSVKPIVEEFKVSGKVDDKMINQLFEAIKKLQQNQADFQLQLASENNDAIVMKMKSVIEKLAALVPENDQNVLASEIAGQLEAKQQKEDVVKYLKDNVHSQDAGKPEEVGEYADDTIAENFNILQNIVIEQFNQLNKNFALTSFKKMLSNALLAPFKSLSNKFNAFKAGIGNSLKGLKDKFSSFGKGLLNKIKMPKIKLPKLKLPKVFGRSKSAKEKKAEKRQSAIFDSLDKLVKRLKKFANNMKEAVLSFLKEIILPAAAIIAEGIEVIIKPVLTALLSFIWGSGIGVILVAIAAGVLLIALGIKKLVDWVVDDIGPEIEYWMSVMKPETINKFMTAVSGLLQNVNTVVSFLLAPLKVINFAVDAILDMLKPVKEFIVATLDSALKHMMPIIDRIFDYVQNVVIKALDTIEPIVMKIIDIVGGTIMTILQAIEPIINELKPTVMLISDIVCGVIKGAVLVIEGIVKSIKTAIQYVRDHWDEFVAFVKSIPGKLLDFIKNNFWVPTFEWGDDSGSSTAISKFLDRVSGMKFLKNYLFLDQKVPFGQQPTKISTNIQQENDINSINKTASSSAEALPDENKAKKKPLTLEDFKNDMVKFLSDFRDVTQKNFEEISKKLDNPQVVPLPLMSQQMNPALQENRW